MKTFTAGVALILVATSASAQTPAQRPDPLKARQKISMMEGLLERAVQNGANAVFRMMRTAMPPGDSPRLVGAPEVRGFPLEGYGVFFDVEVPDLLLPMAWSLRYTMDQNGLTTATALSEWRNYLAQERDPQRRQQLEQAMSRIEMQVGPVGAGPRLASNAAQVAPNTQALPQPAPVDPGVLANPEEEYTKEVKNALVEAMLEYSSSLAIGPEEYLTLAARNARTDRLGVASDPADVQTIMFRVKGSDLSAFHEGRLTLDDARKKVQIKQD